MWICNGGGGGGKGELYFTNCVGYDENKKKKIKSCLNNNNTPDYSSEICPFVFLP